MADVTLDAKGLNCPLPILKAKKAIGDVASGGTLEVLATDPGSVADFEAFCRTTGNELLQSTEEGEQNKGCYNHPYQENMRIRCIGPAPAGKDRQIGCFKLDPDFHQRRTADGIDPEWFTHPSPYLFGKRLVQNIEKRARSWWR